MTPAQAIEWIGAATTPQERAWRKHLTLSIRYSRSLSRAQLERRTPDASTLLTQWQSMFPEMSEHLRRTTP